MKHIIFSFIFITLLMPNIYAQSCPSLSYNGRTYKTVQIGTQCWMAENLNDASHTAGNSNTYDYNNTTLTTTEKQCIADKYGRLYDWDAAMDVDAKIAGWHLPSDAEWTTLSTYLGGGSVAGGKMKVGGGSGFEALLGGYQNSDGSSNTMGKFANFWSSSPNGSGNAWHRGIGSHDASLYRGYYGTGSRYSVRLIKD